MKIGEKLKELRIQNKLTTIQLAKELDTTNASISRWENDVHLPDAEAIKKYCEYFGVSADELLEIEK